MCRVGHRLGCLQRATVLYMTWGRGEERERGIQKGACGRGEEAGEREVGDEEGMRDEYNTTTLATQIHPSESVQSVLQPCSRAHAFVSLSAVSSYACTRRDEEMKQMPSRLS